MSATATWSRKSSLPQRPGPVERRGGGDADRGGQIPVGPPIRQQAIDRQLLAADMSAAAQAARVYDDYLRALAKTHPDDLAVLAVSLIGPRNQLAKLVRHLKLLP